MSIVEIKTSFYKWLDNKADEIALNLVNREPTSQNILKVISDLYKSAKTEQSFSSGNFESAYHSPITSEFEFFISRILFHYSIHKAFDWKIFLRRQQNKTAPDIRIEHSGKTLAIIEVKAKAGWIQPFLSSDRYEYDKQRLQNKKTMFDPDDLINRSRHQLIKYQETFKLEKENIYFLLPTLKLVHRKRYKKCFDDYCSYFTTTSTLPESSFILLSQNMDLDLSHSDDNTIYQPTDRFEKMIESISKIHYN